MPIPLCHCRDRMVQTARQRPDFTFCALIIVSVRFRASTMVGPTTNFNFYVQSALEVALNASQPLSPRLSRYADDYVGSRIRLRRTLLGMTQEQLAATLGISYQQVQKYEIGANRVSSGRLFEMAKELDCEVGFFFEGLNPALKREEMPHGGKNRIAIDLVRNFLDIAREDQRTALANLVKTLRSGHDGDKATPQANDDAGREDQKVYAGMRS